MYYIGVDLGTSAVKLLLMEEDGRILNMVSREYPISFPRPSWSEQKPEDWWQQTREGIRDLLRDYDRGLVGGISFGGQMHGLVVLDREGQVIRPAILWNDSRTTEETEYLNEEVGRDFLSGHTGNIAFAGFTAPKILWMKKREPENFTRIHRIMLPKDYLVYRMTGVHATDVSDASGTLLLDVRSRTWSKEMLAICGIRENMLPRLYESYDCIGKIRPDIAKELGLPENVRVAAGAGDNAASALATGTVGEGKCNLSLGTSGTLFISSDHFHLDESNALHSFCDASGRYHLMGCMLSAASCNKWWTEEILGETDYAGVQSRVDEKRLGENPVFYLPYLMGERSPLNDPYARACFVGMTMDSGQADLTQAVLEGVAFACRDMLETARKQGLVIDRSRLVGGGAKSGLWQKILANVLNLKLDLLETEEGPSLGAAMLAAVACGKYPDPKEAARAIVRVKKTIAPDPDLAAKYQRQYEKFSGIYPALKGTFRALLG
ncbi:xylulokinase [Shuttleworthella satelles]|uniref:xylulokinase n=1 Tax=Shuttleworthella satelles TaxID=177972 RepID=UPI0028D251F8|nr:xylulokinase [Shuttleworthia satelles]